MYIGRYITAYNHLIIIGRTTNKHKLELYINKIKDGSGNNN